MTMAKYELRLPKMGEGVIEATITAWTKNIGDTIEEDETVLEVATDKVDSEVPSEVPGVLVEKFFEVDDVVKVGEVIAIIETDQEIVNEDDDIAVIQNPELEEIIAEPEAKPQDVISEIKSSKEGRFYTPLVKNIAKTEGITQAELNAIAGTGKEGRVTKDDILKYVADKKAGKVVSQAKPAQPAKEIKAPVNIPQPSGVKLDNGDEVIEMDRMRKIIAEHMVSSKQISPHVQSFVEADVTKIVNWRNKVKDEFLQREGEKITFTPIFIYYIVKAIRDYPMVNVQLDGTKIIKKKAINIGMAVALPNGNLIVPVIKNADQLSLTGLTKAVNDLAKRARENKLKPDEITGGTYTVTNIGSFGNIAGSAIINQPQVAIMAVGAIRKMPAVIETSEGDMIGIRQKMILSHSYDHRIVDGMLGGLFAKRVAEYLENFNGEGLL
jgi:2-oxoglutarate dehydrogenase E2 component (dihydrolipoamide succinyltransferase)